jgi:hypothetical protein
MAAGARRQAAAALAAHHASQGLRKASAAEREAKMAVVRGLQTQVRFFIWGRRLLLFSGLDLFYERFMLPKNFAKRALRSGKPRWLWLGGCRRK